MPSNETETIRLTNELKQVLIKRSDKMTREGFLDVLTRMEELPINLTILQKTMVAKVVNIHVCKKEHIDLDIQKMAKALVKKWKGIAKASGVGVSSAKKAPSSVNAATSEKNEDSKVPSKPKISRQQSGFLDIQAGWSKYTPIRRNICQKIMDMLCLHKGDSIPKHVLKEFCASRADEIESEMSERYCSITKKSDYMNKARQLAFNLKKNEVLRERVLMGALSAKNLVSMSSDDLATSEKKQEREKMVEEVNNSRRLDWDQANEKKINEICGIKGDLLKASLFTCGRCKSTKTTSTQKQTRSADEPMTVFVWCMNCGNRWKC